MEAKADTPAHARDVFGAVAVTSEVFDGPVHLLGVLPRYEPHQSSAGLVVPEHP